MRRVRYLHLNALCQSKYIPIRIPQIIRACELSDGKIFLGFSGTANGQTYILGYTSSDKGVTWRNHSTVVQDSSKSFFAPIFYEITPGNILAAYYQRCAANACNIAIKDALYSGGIWKTLGTIQAGGFDWGDGVYEPFWFRKDSNTMQMYYSDETVTKIDGWPKGQNDVMEERSIASLAGDWVGSVTVVAKGDTKGTEYGERFGIHSVARMQNGKLIAFSESTWAWNQERLWNCHEISNNGVTWSRLRRF